MDHIMPIDEMRGKIRRIAHWFDVDLELPLLYQYVGPLKPGSVYLEVGTGITACSSVAAALVSQTGVEVHTVDDMSMWAARGIDEEGYLFRINRNFTQYGVKDRVSVHTTKSIEVAWDKPIDVLYIDGAHDFESVTIDIEKWAPFVVPNGVTMFHDCLTHKAVKKAVDESMRANGSWVELESGGSICVFRKLA